MLPQELTLEIFKFQFPQYCGFDFCKYTSFCSGNQFTCPRLEKAKARLEVMVEEEEVVEMMVEHHELVRGEKLDSWRWLSCCRNKHILSYVKVLELLEGAENGRYKVIAKAEPYKNLPVRLNITYKPLGKPYPTKTDEFSEKFQTAYDPPLIFGKVYCRSLGTRRRLRVSNISSK